jgi:hypothetical protein
MITVALTASGSFKFALSESCPPMLNPMVASADSLGVDLKGSHPFSLKTPLKDAPHLVASLTTTGKTADPLNKVALINGTVECTFCRHESH